VFFYETSERIAIMRLHGVASANDVLPPGLRNTGGFPVKVTSVKRHDPLIERLVRALLPEEEANKVLHGFYAEALHAEFNSSTDAGMASRPSHSEAASCKADVARHGGSRRPARTGL
jgi:hypothetical protein